MSRVAQSPTAQLLRSSRLFSLPPPLPAPIQSVSANVGSTRGSDTATLPYPIRQAIITTPSSRARGDWGLKRPLPLKSTTKSSTPVVRVSCVDTIEQITEFESAADHAITLAKWQELNLPMSPEPSRFLFGNKPKPNVFADERDYTDPAKAEDLPLAQDKRWKRQGPWLSGMAEKDFNLYLAKQLKGREEEFKAFLLKELTPKRLFAKKTEALEKDIPFDEANFKLTLDDMDKEIKRLREDAGTGVLRSELNGYITKFLDLPPARASTAENMGFYTQFDHAAMDNEKLSNAPPSTHPSAGISYLRHNAHLENHPVLGPQNHRTPVPARVLQPRTHTTLPQAPRAIIGVAGFVTEDAQTAGSYPSAAGRMSGGEAGIATLDFETEGGRKVFVEPSRAYVDAQGRIRLEVVRASPETVAIRQGQMPTVARVPPKSSPNIRRVDSRLDDVWGTKGGINPLNDQDAQAFKSQIRDQGIDV